MENHLARRQFLKTVSASLFAGGLMQPVTTQAQSTSDAGETAKTARLFSGCCAYTYRHAFANGSLTLESFIQKAVDLHLNGVDMTVYYMKSTDPGYIENLRYLGYKNGVPFSGAACGASLVQADAAKRAEALADVKKWIDVTERLGASHLRVFAGKLPSSASMKDAITWVVDGMKAASDYSGKKGIVLGLEDHDGVSQTADVCLEIMHRVNSKYVGINIDISHFVPTKEQDSYAQIAACIPYATHTHIRNTFDDGSPIDMDRVWKMFADAGYKGYMSYEGEEKSLTGIPTQIAEIQRLCKKYSTV
ncbi:sugar phosphate isomerase/epimerase family protein [Edaphobacter albus]|uniref:sugar phosphate isomerase/epimerase family protein n=1 Tax=Edaphobacter sp. 4G125 TaxID=2763071 RepID=UPI001644A8F0|nr:sugar phosphate isomerase/epimerase family protein [Edaphobacter sp. 4G125]QNI37358.1 sugar phosphate isomerase/epimerase [Edaphobacter sp. 4G125]